MAEEMTEEDQMKALVELRSLRSTAEMPIVISLLDSLISHLEKNLTPISTVENILSNQELGFKEPASKIRKVVGGICEMCGGKRFIPVFANDLLRNFLLRLPADILFTVMRFVCKEWRKIVDDPDFTVEHLQKSLSYPSLLVLDSRCRTDAYMLKIGNVKNNSQGLGNETDLRLEKTKIFEVQDLDQVQDTIANSFDGLVLLIRGEDSKGYYSVLNPATKHLVNLSPYPVSLRMDLRCYHTGAIGHAKLSKKYKVVHGHITFSTTNDCPYMYPIHVFTLGVDTAWRHVGTEKIRQYVMTNVCNSTLSVGDYVFFHCKNQSIILALGVEDEKIHTIRAPIKKQNSTIQYVKSECHLIFVSHGNDTYDFWQLVDPKTSEWKMLYQVKLNGDPEKGEIEKLVGFKHYYLNPVAVLGEDTVMFSVEMRMRCITTYLHIGYKVNTGKLFGFGSAYSKGIVHLQSLVAIN